MSVYTYQNNQLYCEQVPLAEIATAVDTPVYIYSQTDLINRAHAYLANAPTNSQCCFAVKANGNLHLLKLLGQKGLGADVTSGGELFLAQQAGIPPERIIYSGVGKTKLEITMALKAGIRALHVESELELGWIGIIAAELQVKAAVGVRVNPNISAATHPYISTGLREHKFGVDRDTAAALLHYAQTHSWLKAVGVACHIGSQITTLAPFVTAAKFLVTLADELAQAGIKLEYVDVGGGLGIDYTQNDAPTIADWVTAVAQPVQTANYQLIMEPGRSLIGPTGILLTRVITLKQQGQKQFAIVDAGMNDLIRPTLYQAVHPILPVNQPTAMQQVYDVVGPICESGDWLGQQRPLPPLQPGDLLAITHAGAYGFAMSSNYNGRLRPAELLVQADKFSTIRARQTFADLL
ncbi:MAG: diaminopimelate decarboxylase [Anaerolineales bacterium]|nr:diaminopimelate decarboxylase [Anaerolineales bacterium]